MHQVRLVYYSENRLDPGEAPLLATLQGILRASKRNNAQCGITGALAFDSFWFYQALEGPREAVWSLFLKIMEDARHGNIVLAELVPIEQRLFAAWSMRLVARSAATDAAWQPFTVDGLVRPALMSGSDLTEALVKLTEAPARPSSRVEQPGRDMIPRAAAVAP